MEKRTCPVCGKYEFLRPGDFDICPTCHWQDDEVQTDDPDFEGGANEMSLNQYKKAWEGPIPPQKQSISQRHVWLPKFVSLALYWSYIVIQHTIHYHDA